MITIDISNRNCNQRRISFLLIFFIIVLLNDKKQHIYLIIERWQRKQSTIFSSHAAFIFSQNSQVICHSFEFLFTLEVINFWLDLYLRGFMLPLAIFVIALLFLTIKREKNWNYKRRFSVRIRFTYKYIKITLWIPFNLNWVILVQFISNKNC